MGPDTYTRADYARSDLPVLGAWVASVEKGSPADVAGLEPGMRVDAVNGSVLDDIITWRWESSEGYVELEVFDPSDQETYLCEMWREPGQSWGLEFTDVLFDGSRTCVNACQFCFMAMLPKDVRASLVLRDDDYRLSFLQGNFVTLTNLSDEDVERICSMRLEPMNVSIHAVSEDVRRSLIGRHAQRGMEVLQTLCDEEIEVHAQVVLCPGINDGDELIRTLDWVEARRNITSLALVPLGYTKYSKRFSSSYSDDPDASRRVIEIIAPYQERSRKQDGITRFQLSDEFYVNAEVEVPPAETYDGYPQFYDGIGMLRAFIDEGEGLLAEDGGKMLDAVSALRRRGLGVLVVCGEAARPTIAGFIDSWPGNEPCPADDPSLAPIRIQAIRNDYYGGDVNVTGLIVACDLLGQLADDLSSTVVVLPEVMFNSDGLTLDGSSRQAIEVELVTRGASVVIAKTTPTELACVIYDASGIGEILL